MACRNGERVSGRGGRTSGGLTCAAVFVYVVVGLLGPSCAEAKASYDDGIVIERDDIGFVTREAGTSETRGGTLLHCRDELVLFARARLGDRAVAEAVDCNRHPRRGQKNGTEHGEDVGLLRWQAADRARGVRRGVARRP